MQELIGKEKPITEAYDTVIKGQPVSMLPEKERNISILDLFDNTKADGSDGASGWSVIIKYSSRS